jgi:hypothetical protein
MRPERKSGVGRPHRGEVVPIGSPCEQRRTCWGSERLHFAPGPQPFLTGRAIHVPHPRVDPGTQRTTTVTATPPRAGRLPGPARTHPCTAQRGTASLPDLSSGLREHSYRAASLASLACGRLEAEGRLSPRGLAGTARTRDRLLDRAVRGAEPLHRAEGTSRAEQTTASS